MSKRIPVRKAAGQLDAEIAEALGKTSREQSLRKFVRSAIRGLTVEDKDLIQERVEKLVRIANQTGPKVGLQGDLTRGEDVIELWELDGDPSGPILGIELESGDVVFR